MTRRTRTIEERPRRLFLTCRALAVAGIGAVLLGLSAWAPAAAKSDVEREGWAWVVEQGSPSSLAGASGIDEGQLPVSWAAGEEKVTLVDLALQPRPGDRLTLTMGVDPDGRNYGVDRAELVACTATEPWESAAPMAWDEQPARNCEGATRGVYQPGSNDFFFDLSALIPTLMATGWHGIVFVPKADAAAAPFQVVFRSALGGGSQVRYRRGPEPAPPPDDSGSGASPPSQVDDPSQVNNAALVGPAGGVTAPAMGSPDVGATSLQETALPSTDGPALGAPSLPPAGERHAATLSSTGRRPSFLGFYLGMASLAMLLVVRPLVPVVANLLRNGSEADPPYRRSRRMR